MSDPRKPKRDDGGEGNLTELDSDMKRRDGEVRRPRVTKEREGTVEKRNPVDETERKCGGDACQESLGGSQKRGEYQACGHK